MLSSDVVGPGRILEYVLQGLYHPARFVRDAYWKIYNSLYICGQDALTPVYPRFESTLRRYHFHSYCMYVCMQAEDDPKTGNTYKRTYLELFI